jgi:hypothetical protein
MLFIKVLRLAQLKPLLVITHLIQQLGFHQRLATNGLE